MKYTIIMLLVLLSTFGSRLSAQWDPIDFAALRAFALPTQIEIEGNACITGVINAGEAVKLTPLAAAPIDPVIGLMYFDGTTNKLQVWDGVMWRACW